MKVFQSHVTLFHRMYRGEDAGRFRHVFLWAEVQRIGERGGMIIAANGREYGSP